MHADRLNDLKRFYELLLILEDRLGGARRLLDCSGKMPWPRRGVYFFMEEGELRSDSGGGSRIVTRVRGSCHCKMPLKKPGKMRPLALFAK